MDTPRTADYVRRARAGFAPLAVDAALRERALSNLERWLADELFAEARPHLERLVDDGRFKDLFDAFYQQIPFGTGGRRGRVGFGTNRLNPITVATSIQGHCEYLKRRFPGEELSVVVAYDVRVFKDLKGAYLRDGDTGPRNPLLGVTSKDLAKVAAGVYAANGVTVWFNPPDSRRYLSTPELSFAIRALGAHGGLNISASHNHPDDNGAKVYNASGGQEVPPLDEEMAQIVEGIDRADAISWEEAVASGKVRWIPERVHQEYVQTNLRVSLAPARRSARIVFTPLHGTGWSSVGEVLREAGFDVECLAEQARPDGEFPSVPFRSPNPEVPEALARARDHARARGADLVLAADPDADRLGMMAPRGDGDWGFLSGNQIGVLLVSYMLEGGALRGKSRPFCVTTVVTTSLFRRIAESLGVQCVSDLLIGFKYIANVLEDVEETGRYRDRVTGRVEDFVLGIEESHGYLVVPSIRDKDAAGAALLLAELASALKVERRTVFEYLDDVYRRFGYVANVLRSTVMEGAEGRFDIERIQASLRERPPQQIGGLEVRSFTDRWDEERFGPFLSQTDRAARDLLTFELAGGARIILRPSGTEPKNKVYVEVSGEPLGNSATAAGLAEAKRSLDALAGRIARSFLAEMLARIDVKLPAWALEVSDLVSLRSKQHFAAQLLPEIVARLQRGARRAELEEWIDAGVKPYGSDGRLLVRGGVAAYCREERPAEWLRCELARLFSLDQDGDEKR